MQLGRELAETFSFIKSTVPRVQQVFRRVIDIEQDRVKKAACVLRIEAAVHSRREGKKIAVDEAAARVGGELEAERDHPALMPLNHCIQSFDDEERAKARMPERSNGGVSETEPTDNHIEFRRLECSEPKIGERDFHLVEEARHEKGIAELHLEYFQSIERGDTAAAEGQLTERRLAVVEFGEISAHFGPFISSSIASPIALPMRLNQIALPR